MFEQDLQEKLTRIFRLNKVTLDQESDTHEQNTGFVAVSLARGSIRDRKYLARVEGTLTVYGNTERLKYGFFSKGISQAAKADLNSFYFFDVEENTRMMRNIVQRSISFVFFFSGQYDPDVGTLNSVIIEEAEDE